MKPKVAIVIPSWNRRDDLAICLRSVLAQTYADKEVIVVDNGSADGTLEMLRADFPQVKLIANSMNRGACVAKNQGTAQSAGDYVWFLDSDTEVESPDRLSEMVALMESDATIGSIGGEICEDPDGGREVRKKRVLLNGETVTQPLREEEADLQECDYLATCNCLVRRELLQKVGGFDPGYFYLSEDKELGWRLLELGYRNITDRRTSALHRISTEGGERRLFHKHRNMIRFVVINRCLLILPVLPLLDLYYLFRGSKFADLKGGKRNVSKYLKGPAKGVATSRSSPFIVKLVVVGAIYCCSLAAAYLWNLVSLPKTLATRFRKPDFLAPEAVEP